jgi:glutathione S-transferase
VSLQLFGHPFSSYTMKALIALYENETPFDFRILDPDHPENGAELARRWPIARFPLLVDGGMSMPLQTRSYLLKRRQMAVLRSCAPDCPGSP